MAYHASMSSPPDPDRKSVYYSEEISFQGTRFAEVLPDNDLLALAAELFLTGWWDRFKIPVPTVEPALPGDTFSYATSTLSRTGYVFDIIRLVPRDVSPWVLAHEAAHIAQFYFYPRDRRPDLEYHGREFRACYLNVAHTLLGQSAAEELKSHFDRRLPTRPEHLPGNPGWILTVPPLRDEDRSLDPEGIGLFPRWRQAEEAKVITTLQERLALADPPSSIIPEAVSP